MVSTPAAPGLGRSLAVTPAEGGQEAIREALARHGTALVHGCLADWETADPDSPVLRALRGRDRDRHLALPGAARARFAASRRLLAHLVAAALDTRPGELELGHDPTGRPRIRGLDEICLSLSHTGRLLLAGLSTRGLLGVDAEAADRALRSRSLVGQLCTPWELGELALLPQAAGHAGLVRLWTLKEAYTKAIGQGMQFPFTAFGFGFGDGPVRLLLPDGRPAADTAWSFGSFGLVSGGEAYRVSAALRDEGRASAPGLVLDAEVAGAVTAALYGGGPGP
ncbi:4'-phosphopantetheinyl transferase family protein [Streptomyces physcomitrii]|uniref:4'-phosphopantetheinyl transferase family protein n=1 Tax=Streptomyces physcomitrii TaxID=2724184 RepID=UPI0028AFB4D8|nr:4'-phosphopantetheinyl transferase superfamily protein [Streptomyces physcomitrii]